MKKTFIIIGIIALVGALGYALAAPGKPGQYDGLAQCIADKGAVFYGAFWCSHCREQKAMFGKSAQFLPYVECSTPDSRGMVPVCEEKGIKGFPTWIFADGSVVEGTMSIERLAEKTACEAPQTI